MRALATAAGLLLTASLLGPTATATAAPSARDCITIKARQNVAVRYDPDPRSKVVGHLKRGAKSKSCRMTWSNQFRACGEWGKWWYLVRGGFVPKTCVNKV
ncbi:hypothetical protein [Streptomyces lycii]|uniref:SH3 domain-containing protein n=1 Tax=Streptomyces lycii TaxID=2654337 RepID=A0ABQ7FMD0_9ACTN|nr:hypothetical protein [Streptomyces lycii]KAF4408921.1 hypothetical protein GCU69_11590 [Streptomyces lycii]